MESLHNLSNQSGGFVERFNAWYVSERPVTWKDYLDGQAYLEWAFHFPALDRWHKAFFVTKKIDTALDFELGLVPARNMPVSEVARTGDRQNSPVFVDQVHLVEVDERVEPSWIWFQITNNLFGGFTGFPNFVFNPAFEVEAVSRGREGGVVRASPGSRGTGRNEVVEGGAKVVDRIADCDREFGWRRLRERNVEPMLARTKVQFLPDQVRVLAEIAENEVVHLSNVRLRALQLQNRA